MTSPAIPHPTAKEVSQHIATLQRLGSYVEPRVECSWCGKELRAGQEPTSHGICEECSAEMLAEVG